MDEQAGSEDVRAFLDGIEDEHRRQDAYALLELMSAATGTSARLWPGGIVGFGTHHYQHESGRQGETVAIGFSPRKAALAVYGIRSALTDDEAARLGPVTAGKGCLYVKRFESIDPAVLQPVLARAYADRRSG